DPIAGEPVTFHVGTQSAIAITDANGVAQASVQLTVPPGDYIPSAALTTTDGLTPSSADSAQTLTVTKQPTLVMLEPTVGTLPTGDTSFTARVCATSASTCGDNDPPVSQRTVVFVLTGPAPGGTFRTSAALTDGSGQVRFDAFGLPAGAYTL